MTLARQTPNDFTSTESSAMVGAGDGRSKNVAGYRFTQLTIPKGAVIDSVQFSLVKDGSEWHSFVADIAFDAVDDAATFGASAQPDALDRRKTRRTFSRMSSGKMAGVTPLATAQ